MHAFGGETRLPLESLDDTLYRFRGQHYHVPMIPTFASSLASGDERGAAFWNNDRMITTRVLSIVIPLCFFASVTGALGADAEGSVDGGQPKVHLVIHGGAGTLLPEEISDELEAQYQAKLAEALEIGHEILRTGGNSVDAVEQTIRVLEDSPLFNAGRGSVFTADGHNEMDASIMNGSDRNAGAVAGVTKIKHPISAARAVMERSPHVMLSGAGADAFSSAEGMETVSPEYLWTERRWEALQKRRQSEGQAPLPRPAYAPQPSHAGSASAAEERETSLGLSMLGTVGAVALDAQGILAAGTSTGGMTYKRHGRIGDSPVIGAGTYADDLCGVSSTGHGEYFIRWAVAHEICALIRHRGLSSDEAARRVIHDILEPVDGSGGVIVLSSKGEPALVFNTKGMYRGWIGADGVPHTAIFSDDS